MTIAAIKHKKHRNVCMIRAIYCISLIYIQSLWVFDKLMNTVYSEEDKIENSDRATSL